jgi:hypothetical protein
MNKEEIINWFLENFHFERHYAEFQLTPKTDLGEFLMNGKPYLIISDNGFSMPKSVYDFLKRFYNLNSPEIWSAIKELCEKLNNED